MNIAVFMNTPAQVHFFKNIIKGLRELGHNVIVLGRRYGETGALIDELGLECFNYAPNSSSMFRKLLYIPFDVLRAFKYLSKHNVDLVLGFGVYDSLTAFLLNADSIVFMDSEPSIDFFQFIEYKISLPFARLVITPTCFRDDLGRKHVKVDSYKELAYLHPRYYSPDKSVLDLMGVDDGEEYALVRFNTFDALHDVSKGSFSVAQKMSLVNELAKRLRVFVSFEGKIPKALEKYKLNIPKYRIHDALSFAKILVTDTQTMATEAALLGTPVIRSNSFVGANDMGIFIELEKKHGLIYNLDNFNMALDLSIEIISNVNIKKEWLIKKNKFFADKININDYIINLILYYFSNGINIKKFL